MSKAKEFIDEVKVVDEAKFGPLRTHSFFLSTAISGHSEISKGLKHLLQSDNPEHAKLAKKLQAGYDKLWKEWKGLRDSRPFPKDVKAEEESDMKKLRGEK